MWPFIGELISGMPFDWPALNSFYFFYQISEARAVQTGNQLFDRCQ